MNETRNATQPVIHAVNMLVAQSAKLDQATRTLLTSKANRYREITGETGKTDMNVKVEHPVTGELLGYVTYRF